MCVVSAITKSVFDTVWTPDYSKIPYYPSPNKTIPTKFITSDEIDEENLKAF